MTLRWKGWLSIGLSVTAGVWADYRTEAHGPVRAYTLAQLQMLDVGWTNRIDRIAPVLRRHS